MFIFGVLTARLAARFGARLVLLAGATVSAIGYAILAFAHPRRGRSTWLLP